MKLVYTFSILMVTYLMLVAYNKSSATPRPSYNVLYPYPAEHYKEEETNPEAIVGITKAMPPLNTRRIHKERHRHSRHHKNSGDNVHKNGIVAFNGDKHQVKVSKKKKINSQHTSLVRRENLDKTGDNIVINEKYEQSKNIFYLRAKRNSTESQLGDDDDLRSDDSFPTKNSNDTVESDNDNTKDNKGKGVFINEVTPQIDNQTATPAPATLEVRIKHHSATKLLLNLVDDGDDYVDDNDDESSTTTTTTTVATTTVPQPQPQPTSQKQWTETAPKRNAAEYGASIKDVILDLINDNIDVTTQASSSTVSPPPSTTTTTTLTTSRLETTVSPKEIANFSLNSNGRFGSGRKDINLVQDRPEANSKTAIFRGLTIGLESGNRVFAFYGIGYAAPPVGKLRFKHSFPVHPSSKDGIFEATRLNPPCFPSRVERSSTSAAATLNKEKHDEQQQLKGSQNYTAIASEDCLYLNMWLPDQVVRLNPTLYPVLVWIHGEGFLSGMDKEDYQTIAEFVAKTNIIVVAFQYRLGVFGFLQMNSSKPSGNAGLQDQVLALKWIEENVESFGGDPHAVTLMGHDIGAAFVGFHLLSTISPGYFSRAVMIGGTPLQPHLLHSKQHANRMALELAKPLRCANSRSTTSIMACLQNMDPVSIWQVQTAMQQQNDSPFIFPFVATEDGAIVSGNLANQLANGRGKTCPVLVGGSSNGGSLVLANTLEGVLLAHSPNQTFISYDKFLSIIYQFFSGQFSQLELDSILHQYKNWANLTDGYANQIRAADAVGDYYFTCPLRKFSDFWSARGLTTYHFTFSLQSLVKNRSKWMGAVHGDELDYFFGVPLRFPNAFSKQEVELGVEALKILESFVKTGDPHEDWMPYGKETPHFAEFNERGSIYGTNSEPRYGPRMEHCAFWNELLPKIVTAAGNSVKSSTGGDDACTGSSYNIVNPESFGAEGVSNINANDTPTPDSSLRSQSFSVDDNCFVSLHNCSRSNFAIYVN